MDSQIVLASFWRCLVEDPLTPLFVLKKTKLNLNEDSSTTHTQNWDLSFVYGSNAAPKVFCTYHPLHHLLSAHSAFEWSSSNVCNRSVIISINGWYFKYVCYRLMMGLPGPVYKQERSKCCWVKKTQFFQSKLAGDNLDGYHARVSEKLNSELSKALKIS